MAIAAAISAASYSIVLANTFAALGMSTLVPAAFLSVMDAAHEAGDDEGDREDATDAAAAKFEPLLQPLPVPSALGGAAADAIAKSAAKMLGAIATRDNIDLLVPTTAKIHAEFEFNNRQSTSLDVAVGAQLNVVTINAGFAALYEASSSNKITLDVDFATVNYRFE